MRRTQIERGEGMENDFKITLKALRANKGVTLSQAAKDLNVSKTTLSSWENAITYPRVNELPKIEKYYNMKYDKINFLIKNTVKP